MVMRSSSGCAASTTSMAVISLVIEAIGVCMAGFFASSGCPLPGRTQHRLCAELRHRRCVGHRLQRGYRRAERVAQWQGGAVIERGSAGVDAQHDQSG